MYNTGAVRSAHRLPVRAGRIPGTDRGWARRILDRKARLQYGVAPQFAAASVRVPVGFTRAADGSIVPKYAPGTGGYDDVTRRQPIFTSNTARGSFGVGPRRACRPGPGRASRWAGPVGEAGGVPAAGAGPITPARAHRSAGDSWDGSDDGPVPADRSFERMSAAYQGAKGQFQPAVPTAGGVTPSGLIVPPVGRPGVPTDDAGKGFTTTDKRPGHPGRRRCEGHQDRDRRQAAETPRRRPKRPRPPTSSPRPSPPARRGRGTLGKAVAQTAVAMGTAGAGMAKFGAGLGGQAFEPDRRQLAARCGDRGLRWLQGDAGDERGHRPRIGR